MPFPNPDTQFKPGQSGNPGGHSSTRRLASAIIRLLDEEGLDRDVALTLVAKALGRKDILKDRAPDYVWFRELLDRVDGPLNARSDDPAPTTAVSIDPDVAVRIMQAAQQSTPPPPSSTPSATPDP
ncbi:MAG: hypothetical protein ACYDCI_00085 [Candidatus Limnocylindrales bacterium]